MNEMIVISLYILLNFHWVSIYNVQTVHVDFIQQVRAFRSMMHNDMMIGAFSHSTAVGKLRKELPEVPTDARINFPRYDLEEADTVCHYYLRYVLLNSLLLVYDSFISEN